MRTPLAVTFALVLGIGTISAQAPIPLGPGDAVGFDYEIAEFTASQVIRFERRAQIGATVYDWSNLGIPPTTGGAPAGWVTYLYPPTYWPVDVAVTVWFRACNATACSVPSDVATFIRVSSTPPVVPVAPSQVRRIIGGT